MDGSGKLNWRLVWKQVYLPYDTPRLKVQIWDDDPTADDSIAEANLNLKGFFKKALKKKGAHIGSTIPGSGGGPNGTGAWLDTFHPNFEGVQGKICLEIDLLPKAEADRKKAGMGRSEPNDHPYLPEPIRPKRKWLSDFADFLKLGKLKKYIIGCCICLVIIAVIYLVTRFT